jgi:hypothetical protein
MHPSPLGVRFASLIGDCPASLGPPPQARSPYSRVIVLEYLVCAIPGLRRRRVPSPLPACGGGGFGPDVLACTSLRSAAALALEARQSPLRWRRVHARKRTRGM